jgi:hypothetical protein
MLVSGGGPAGAPPAGACAYAVTDKPASAIAATIFLRFFIDVPLLIDDDVDAKKRV